MKKPIILFINALKPQLNTIDYGVHLAKSFQLPLLLYSIQYTPIYTQPSLGPIAAPILNRPGSQEEKGRKALDGLCQQVKQQWKHTDCELVTGYFADSIVEKSDLLLKKAEELQPTLLITGQEHEYFWWHRVTGTTATEVAENAPCPVLVVPPTASFSGIEQITYLLDEEELYSKKMSNLKWLTLLGNKFNAVLSFLYLPEDEKMPDKELDKAMTKIQSLTVYQRKEHKQLMPDSSVKNILKYVKETPVDLVAFPYWERSFFQRLLGHDDSRRLILKVNVPILVF